MENTIIAIRAKVTERFGKETDLLIHRLREESASPCVVVENGVRRIIGGHIETIEEMLRIVTAEHPGCVLTDRCDLVKL